MNPKRFSNILPPPPTSLTPYNKDATTQALPNSLSKNKRKERNELLSEGKSEIDSEEEEEEKDKLFKIQRSIEFPVKMEICFFIGPDKFFNFLHDQM
nr:15025_t:CDS:2 [Entrophospora candida]